MQMNEYIWFLILTIATVTSYDCPVTYNDKDFWNNNTVTYYEELIQNETQQASSYVLPKNNDYFLNGADSKEDRINFGEYDFIIVGAGSSGSILTYKLSQNETWKILLLEAGSNETDFSVIPYYAPYLPNSGMNWGYYTEPQEYVCINNNDNRCSYPRGKSLGGSGAINYMFHVRGNKGDYDSWAEDGNEGWSYEDVLPYFIDLEDTDGFGDLGYRGQNGPIRVELPSPPSPFLANFLEANVEIGRQIVDYNGKQQMGASVSQLSIVRGRRESGGNVFVRRAACRENLDILELSLVTKVLVSNDSMQAYGVEFTKGGYNYTATVRKEVILSAGTINTPQLLMLSGIGPSDELQKFGIEVKMDLPEVGCNMQDHTVLYGIKFSTNSTTSAVSLEDAVEMYLDGFGPLTKCVNDEGVSFYRVNNSTLPGGVPDIQLFFASPNTINGNSSTIQMFPVLLHPKSRGNISLASANPFEFPLVNFPYLHEEEDRQTFYEGIEAIFDLIETDAFKSINATYLRPNISECDEYEFRSKSYWICNLKYNGAAFWHSTSTARMGSVVDNKLKVKGIGNLRIVDCSVMPHITSGNTNIPAFMIGAKAADLIKVEHGG